MVTQTDKETFNESPQTRMSAMRPLEIIRDIRRKKGYYRHLFGCNTASRMVRNVLLCLLLFLEDGMCTAIKVTVANWPILLITLVQLSRQKQKIKYIVNDSLMNFDSETIDFTLHPNQQKAV